MRPQSSRVNTTTTASPFDDEDTFHSLEEMQEKCQITESLLGHLDITMQTGTSVVVVRLY